MKMGEVLEEWEDWIPVQIIRKDPWDRVCQLWIRLGIKQKIGYSETRKQLIEHQWRRLKELP